MDILLNLEPLLRTFWFIALPVSLIFLIQTILTFVGGDVDSDTNIDHDGFQLFSLRNLVNFLLGFSWTGISFYYVIANKPILMLVSLAVGSLFIFIFFIIIKQIQKLAEDNSFSIAEVVNKTAEVYLTIPERKKGRGKIMVSVRGAYHELDAVTENDAIPTGAIVKVVRVEENNLIIVETI